MQRQTKSLLEELEELGKNRDTVHIIENRGNNIIASAINLLEMIRNNFSEQEADLLEKRLLSAIKNKDQSKFSKHVRKAKKI